MVHNADSVLFPAIEREKKKGKRGGGKEKGRKVGWKSTDSAL